MDPTDPLFNNQLNQQFNSQQPSQFDSQSQSYTQLLLNPHYPLNAFTQFTAEPPQFSSPQPSQANDMQQPTMQRKKNVQGQPKKRERNRNWTKEEDEALCKPWLFISEDAATSTE